jgi:Lon protease-like protein
VEFAPQYPVPVFPLPEVVLFPHVLLPLHVFELRYRTMVRDALSRERLLALATLRPGWQADYRDSPAFFPVGCLARFETVEWLPNDCYDLRVLGIARVRFGRVAREIPYRAATVSLLAQDPFTEDDPLIQLERRALFDSYLRLVKAAGEGSEAPSIDADCPFEALVNSIATVAGGDGAQKLELLELDHLVERSRRLRERLEAMIRSLRTGPREGDRN